MKALVLIVHDTVRRLLGLSGRSHGPAQVLYDGRDWPKTDLG